MADFSPHSLLIFTTHTFSDYPCIMHMDWGTEMSLETPSESRMHKAIYLLMIKGASRPDHSTARSLY